MFKTPGTLKQHLVYHLNYLTAKYSASGWWRIIALVDCSGTIMWASANLCRFNQNRLLLVVCFHGF